MREIILIGAGGHAKAIIAAAQQAGITVRAVYDDDESRRGQALLGVTIVGPLAEARLAGLPAILALDDPRRRKAAAEQLDLTWATVIHPKAFLHPSATVGAGTVILAGVVVQPNVVVGRHAMIAANATVAHDCVVEDFAQLWPGVDLAGHARVAEGACIGVGAVVILKMKVGAWATVGPRAAVIQDVPENVDVQGVPATAVDDGDPPSGSGERPNGATSLAILILIGTVVTGLSCTMRRRHALARWIGRASARGASNSRSRSDFIARATHCFARGPAAAVIAAR